jgi:hypothetical protein
LRHEGKKKEWMEYNKFFQDFKNLMTDTYNCKIIYPTGTEFYELLGKCDCLRIGQGETHDKLNIATAISNECAIFLTSDEAIYKESKRIKGISGGKLEIVYVKK